ncbi:hypothetical protein KGA65_00870 [Ideonella sp. B7]|uniref:hypothetical protein n=1 Tax=Ideonella benzenivorans TaxID=2831643 RepID=UPI001CED39FA|nr:hypothetical protein [Ideonella benzenivorans]MCA6215079.1 hypothetical protein [Ideonella benzenivorans]
MKKIFLVAVSIALSAVAYFSYSKYEQRQFMEALLPHVKNVSLRVANSARYETEADTKITFKELFEKLELDISEVDKHLIEVQTISSPKTAPVSDPVVTYLKASQEYLRAMLQKYRKTLAFSSANDFAEKSLDDLRTSSGYGFDFAKRSADQAIKELGKAEEELSAAVPELRATTEKLKAARATLAATFPADALIPVEQLDAVIGKNSAKPGVAASATH